MPGRWTWSGSRAPAGTTSSTSAMVTRAAIATCGLKLRAVLRKTRLPWVSAFQAWTSAKSPRSGRSRRYSLAVDGPHLLALGDLGAHAGAGVEAADAGAAGAQPLGQGPLRHELHLELAGEVLALELLVLADVARHDALDLARLEERPEPEVGGAAVVGDQGEPLHAAPVERGDEVLRVAAQAEAAHQHGGAVGDVRHGRVGRLDELVHDASAPYRSTSSATASPPPMQSEATPRCLPQVLHGLEQRHQDARPGGADGVAERHRAAADVDRGPGRGRAAGCWRRRPPRRPR